MIHTGHLPALQADETVYSWCATAQIMSGWQTGEGWSKAVLGMAHGTRQFDFQAYLPGLVSAHLPHLSLVDCLRHHTLAGMFWPFVSTGSKASLCNQVEDGRTSWPQSAHSARRILLCHSRSLSWKAQLRHCHQCVLADVERIGRPYWHVQHQWPVSRMCTIHGSQLQSGVTTRKTWHLPTVAEPAPTEGQISDCCINYGMQVQRVAQAFSEHEIIDTDKLRSSALHRLQQMGVIHSTYAARHSRISSWYKQHPASAWCAKATDGLAALASPDWIPKLLWRRTQDHPVRWAILWAALDWNDCHAAGVALADSQRDLRVNEFGQLSLFENQAVSSTTSDRQVPDFFRLALEKELSYANLMTRLQVSRGDIVRWLEQDPLCRQIWRQRLKQHKIDEAAKSLRDFMQMHRSASRNEINIVMRKEVRLLEVHSPDQLLNILKTTPSRKSNQRLLFIEHEKRPT